MTTIYLDTSALVKLYVEEVGRETVFGATEESGRLATSTVAYAEARAAFARKKRIGDLGDEGSRLVVADLDAEWRNFVRVPVTNSVAYRAGALAERYALRGFDAVHLASAVRLSEQFDDLRFLAFDDKLVAAAREASVPVYGGT